MYDLKRKVAFLVVTCSIQSIFILILSLFRLRKGPLLGRHLIVKQELIEILVFIAKPFHMEVVPWHSHHSLKDGPFASQFHFKITVLLNPNVHTELVSLLGNLKKYMYINYVVKNKEGKSYLCGDYTVWVNGFGQWPIC